MTEPKVAKHKIEESVQVYLLLSADGKRWEIDPTCFGESLYSNYDDGPLNEACDCDDKEECERVRKAADQIGVPDGEELAGMLNEYLAAETNHG
jgi:hypothetical protein